MNTSYLEHSKMFKAFCDEKRLKIVHLLIHGEKCACTLMEDMGMAQSALSYHMKILCDSSIVKARQNGKWTFYSLNTEQIKGAAEYLLEIVQEDNEEKI